MKRIFAGILSVAMLISALPAFAVETDDFENVDDAVGENVIDIYDEDDNTEYFVEDDAEDGIEYFAEDDAEDGIEYFMADNAEDVAEENIEFSEIDLPENYGHAAGSYFIAEDGLYDGSTVVAEGTVTWLIEKDDVIYWSELVGYNTDIYS